MSLRRWLSRHALALWFLGVTILGLLRFWLEWREARGAPLAVDGWLWLAGSVACAVVAVLAFCTGRGRDRH